MNNNPVFIRLLQIIEQACESSLDNKTDRAIYEGLYQKKLGYSEIAAELGIEETAVRQRVHHLALNISENVYVRIQGDQQLRKMLQHFLDAPKRFAGSKTAVS